LTSGPDAMQNVRRGNPKMPRLRAFVTFCTVVELRSFTRAAESLGVTQPAVSQQIKRLEDEYGASLVHREGFDVVPTDEGRIVYKYASQIVHLYERSRQHLLETANQLSGTLRVGASTGLGEVVLPTTLARFKADHPDVHVLMQVGDSSEILERILQGQIDIGFVGIKRRDRHLRFEPFVQDRLILVVSPDHEIASRKSLRLKQFLEVPLVLQQPGSGATLALREALQVQGVRLDQLNVIMEVGLQESTKTAVRSGVGGTVISRLGAIEELRAGTLVEVAVEDVELHHDFFVVSRRSLPLSRLSRAFLAAAQGALK
jgi:DNA-binding transcriptional LysR family regulator